MLYPRVCGGLFRDALLHEVGNRNRAPCLHVELARPPGVKRRLTVTAPISLIHLNTSRTPEIDV